MGAFHFCNKVALRARVCVAAPAAWEERLSPRGEAAARKIEMLPEKFASRSLPSCLFRCPMGRYGAPCPTP
ncbi:MAG: hypothetical protein F6J93_32965 [Oscillatoria sp. SIO1A7]|nr:hypothetical protein [Oscillatoria sp. SIO1A7]